MKKLKTEIQDKPLSATHYRNECEHYEFSWVKFINESMHVWDETYWDEVEDGDFESTVKPIPQEEMSAFSGEVEWKNGDTCIADEYFGDELLTFVGMAHSLSYGNDCVVMKNGNAVPMRVELLSKPETQQQREERERLEAAYDLYLAFWSAMKSTVALESFEDFSCGGNSDLKHFLAVVDKTNYRKEK